MKCNQCGSENQTQKFCSNCGAPIVQTSNIPPQQPVQQPKKSSTAAIIIIIAVIILLPFVALGIIVAMSVMFVNDHKEDFKEVYEQVESEIKEETTKQLAIGYWNCEDTIYLNIEQNEVGYIKGVKYDTTANSTSKLKIDGTTYSYKIDEDELKLTNEDFSYTCEKTTKTKYDKRYQEVSSISTTSTNKSIKGDYLSDSGSFYTFTDKEFYWYKEEDVKDDNYWYGSMKIYSRSEIKDIDDMVYEDMGEIIDQGGYKENQIFYLELKPTKLISGGEDKTSTISKDANLNMIVIKTSEKEMIGVSYATLTQFILTKK